MSANQWVPLHTAINCTTTVLGNGFSSKCIVTGQFISYLIESLQYKNLQQYMYIIVGHR